MSGNGTVHGNLLEAIRSGKLPGRSPERTWAGPGCGALCMICGEPVNADELEYELEFAPGGHSKRPEGHHLHVGCFWAWETERHKLELNRGTEKAMQLSAEVAEARLAEDEREISGSGESA
jgi:hypothetical protein